MTDVLVALGLVLVIEGLLWAVTPHLGRRLLAAASAMPDQSLQVGGVVAIAAGVGIVWLVRG
jgi:uncharacterized protein YjeT (DUF2065 family)